MILGGQTTSALDVTVQADVSSTVFQLGIRSTLTGCTFLPATSLSDASPEAVTRSNPPWFISVTISSEVAAVLTLTLQPVSFSKSVTQSYALSDLAALDVTGPGDDIDFTLALTDGFRRFGKRDATKGEQGNDSD